MLAKCNLRIKEHLAAKKVVIHFHIGCILRGLVALAPQKIRERICKKYAADRSKMAVMDTGMK